MQYRTGRSNGPDGCANASAAIKSAPTAISPFLCKPMMDLLARSPGAQFSTVSGLRACQLPRLSATAMPVKHHGANASSLAREPCFLMTAIFSKETSSSRVHGRNPHACGGRGGSFAVYWWRGQRGAVRPSPLSRRAKAPNKAGRSRHRGSATEPRWNSRLACRGMACSTRASPIKPIACRPVTRSGRLSGYR